MVNIIYILFQALLGFHVVRKPHRRAASATFTALLTPKIALN